MLEDPRGCDYEHEFDREKARRAARRLTSILIAFLAAGALLALTGCAGHALDGICAVQHIGENDGIQFVRYHCEPSP